MAVLARPCHCYDHRTGAKLGPEAVIRVALGLTQAARSNSAYRQWSVDGAIATSKYVYDFEPKLC